MKSCRVCKLSKDEDSFVSRGFKKTNCCLDCSTERATSDYCDHGTRYHDCRFCIDGRLISARMTLHSSKTKDKRVKHENDLDFQHLSNMFFTNDNCYYCHVTLQHEYPYASDFATLERLNDDIGHTKENTVIACRYCNCGQRKFLHIIKAMS